MFSILIPTYNNLAYLKLCIESIEKNSKYKHQILIHVNEGVDGTLDFVKNSVYNFTFSEENIGMPKALNKISKFAKNNYIVISHDDFYYCPGWDEEFVKEIKKINHNNFYLSGTTIGATNSFKTQNGILPAFYNAGDCVENFDENKLLNNIENIKSYDFQGSTKQPGLVHIDLWRKVGGWSEEFSPTGGDDTDFLAKLWFEKVRIFKGLGKSLVYHFGSITTRKKGKNINTYLGSRGGKVFLRKWKMSINFFEKYYLNSGIDKNKKKIVNVYSGPLNKPEKNIEFFYELLKCKIKNFYLVLINFNYKK